MLERLLNRLPKSSLRIAASNLGKDKVEKLNSTVLREYLKNYTYNQVVKALKED